MPNAMSVLQNCKACNHEFRVPQNLVGKTIPCPHCRKPIQVATGAAVVSNDDKLVGREVGSCKLLRRLGAGALGVVYEAEQTSVGRKVAIKMLSSKAASDPEVVARFGREARLCAQIRHPNVVGVYDCGFERGVHYLLMEFVDGTTWANLIEELGRQPWQDALRFAMQVAKALEYVHGQNIIHRDIKPANILVEGATGAAKLADLGLGKNILADQADGQGLTMQGVAMGSPAYMPPEQIRDAKAATPVSDLYALGASLYQAVSGQLPFDGRTATDVMTKVLREPPPHLHTIVPDLPAGVVSLIMRMLAKDPAERIPSATEFIREVEAVLANPEQVRGKAKGLAKAGGAGGGIPLWVWVAAAGVVAAGAAAAFLL